MRVLVCKIQTLCRILLQPAQFINLSLSAYPSGDKSCIAATLDFVSRTLEDVLRRRSTESGGPPPLDLTCAHAIDVS